MVYMLDDGDTSPARFQFVVIEFFFFEFTAAVCWCLSMDL
jgi:hypothetical protein